MKVFDKTYNLSSSSTANCRSFLKNLRLIVKCGICGHKQKIEFHHIKRTKLNGNGRGLNKRALDIMTNPDCYIPICHFCHEKVTYDDITIFKGVDGILRYSKTDKFFWKDVKVI